jgi:CheY-like chemotaxis protein
MKKIVIIEDDSLIIKILDFVLKKYETHISRDGADGINQIDLLKPDLIITDI